MPKNKYVHFIVVNKDGLYLSYAEELYVCWVADLDKAKQFLTQEDAELDLEQVAYWIPTEGAKIATVHSEVRIP